MSEKMSRNKKAALETLESVGRKTMVWSLVIAFWGAIIGGKWADLWQVMIPLSIIAGIAWFWVVGRFPDEEK